MCFLDIRTTFLCLCFLSLMTFGAGTQSETQKQPTGESFEKAIADRELLRGYFSVYKGKKDLRIGLDPEQLDRKLGFSASLVGALGDYQARNSSFRLSPVAFEKWGESVALMRKNTQFRADAGDVILEAVESSFPDSPLAVLPILATEPNSGTLLFDLTPALNVGHLPFFLEGSNFDVHTAKPSILSVRNHPHNLTITVAYHLKRRDLPKQDPGRVGFGVRLVDAHNLEVRIQYDFFDLPKNNYRPRIADDRVSLWALSWKNYSNLEAKDTTFQRVFFRWHLEPLGQPTAQHPVAVKKPIILYIGKATPRKYRPLIKEGALWWNQAFEEIGLRDVLEVRDQPSDSSWHPTEIGHNMIHWHVGDRLGFSAMAGVSLNNPETGQTLRGSIWLNALFPSFVRNRFMVYSWGRSPRQSRQVESCDYQRSLSNQIAFARLVLRKRGRLQSEADLDELFRQTFLMVVAHEVDHFLGLPHNFKASLQSSYADLKAGKSVPLSGSIMDYFSVHIPDKQEQPVRYMPTELGIYDKLAIEYLYRDFSQLSPEEERRELDKIAARAEVTPGLAYGGHLLGDIDPTINNHDFGDDALSFAGDRLQMARDEVLPSLVQLVTEEGHELHHIRQALDAAVFGVCMDAYDILVRHIGGQRILRLHLSSPVWKTTPPIAPVSRADQIRALELLDQSLFAEDAFRFTPELLAHLQADLQIDWQHFDRFGKEYLVDQRMAFLFETVLAQLLNPRRLSRVQDNENRYRAGEASFSLAELFLILDTVVFRDIQRPQIHRFRRVLQKKYVDRLIQIVSEPSEPAKGRSEDTMSLATLSLVELIEKIEGASSTEERVTTAHRLTLKKKIEKILDL